MTRAQHPIDEWDSLKDIPLEDFPEENYDNKGNFRITKCTATIKSSHDDCDLKFRITKKKLRIDFGGWHEIETVEKERCNLGHRHNIVKDKKFCFLWEELTPDEAKRLGAWLLRWGNSV